MATDSDLKRSIFERIASISRVLSSAPRLNIIQILAQSPRSVEVLSQLTGESIANTSQHLQKLLHERLISCRKEGVSRIYRLDNPQVLKLWEDLQDLAHDVAPELDKAEQELTDSTLRSPISAEDWLRQVQEGKALLLDVRDNAEAASTPVRNALSIPLEDLEKELRDLPHDRPIIVLCRGRYCTMASHGVRELRQKGFEAYRLRESAFQINHLWETL
jgi:DNA-binding transcriptional ArsR family regulator